MTKPTPPSASHWRQQFGIEKRSPPSFFSSQTDMERTSQTVPQAHLLRRAFKELKIDGALFCDGSLAVYFRAVTKITIDTARSIQQSFWNQGIAPILVLMDSDNVHIHSAFARPNGDGNTASLIEQVRFIDSDRLQAFVREVETGDYFRKYHKFFNPENRVDRTLLEQLSQTRLQLDKHSKDPAAFAEISVRLLCRVVFTCYLFDRKIIGPKYLESFSKATDLRDMIRGKDGESAKRDIYTLFKKLERDFNGDIFGVGLGAEYELITPAHVGVIQDFLEGTNPTTGQRSFWPYEFSVIPIEVISAIYERFLKAVGRKEKKEKGAFYTPRPLAEIVLELATRNDSDILSKQFLDPACGSGIFLVGAFNCLAEEWIRQHPTSSYDEKLRGLSALLTGNIRGVDESPNACLIAAFSLYLALLDHMSPPDIQQILLLMDPKVLPPLVGDGRNLPTPIVCADFFSGIDAIESMAVDYVVGNPPWAESLPQSAADWCQGRKLITPSQQLATAFTWKVSLHLKAGGRACLVLPHGLFFNHTEITREFRRQWLEKCTLRIVVNLADLQRFLFDDAEVPAVVVKFTASPHADRDITHYWTPKSDWPAIRADIISLHPHDRVELTGKQILTNASTPSSPSIWKAHFWATRRDLRFLDRLAIYSQLEKSLGTRRGPRRRWTIAEGYEPYNSTDEKKNAKRYRIALTDIIPLTAKALNEDDFILSKAQFSAQSKLNLTVRRRISDLKIFKAPLVLVSEGYTKVVFSQYDVAYKHGVRGIHGPTRDRELLMFLSAYLQSKLAQYFLFHTSSSWGVNRRRVDVEDLMLLPWFFPEESDDPKSARKIVKESAAVLWAAKNSAEKTRKELNALVNAYFDVSDAENILVEDSIAISEPSSRPGRNRAKIPTIMPVREEQRNMYVKTLCAAINAWADPGFVVTGTSAVAHGAVIVMIEKGTGESVASFSGAHHILDLVQRLCAEPEDGGVIRWIRGVKIFDGNKLYIAKPRQHRFWTRTEALNDADAIVDAILSRGVEK